MTTKEEFASFKKGDVIVGPEGEGIFIFHHGESLGYMECITTGKGWLRTSSIPEDYVSMAANKYWCICNVDGYTKKCSSAPLTGNKWGFKPGDRVERVDSRGRVIKTGTYIRDRGAEGIINNDATGREYTICMPEWRKQEEKMKWGPTLERGQMGIYEQLRAYGRRYCFPTPRRGAEMTFHTSASGMRAFNEACGVYEGIEKLPEALIIKGKKRKSKILIQRL